MASNNQLLGMVPKQEVITEKVPVVKQRVPIFMFHETLAPSGYHIKTEAELDRVLAQDGWVDTPAKFGQVSEPAPVPEPTVDTPPVPMDGVIDETQEEPGSQDEVPPEEQQEELPPEEETVDQPPEMFACEYCGKQMASQRALGGHMSKCPQKPKVVPPPRRR